MHMLFLRLMYIGSNYSILQSNTSLQDKGFCVQRLREVILSSICKNVSFLKMKLYLYTNNDQRKTILY